MQSHRLFLLSLCGLLFVCSLVSAQSSTYTYPFSNGRAELPALVPVRYKPIYTTFSIANSTDKPADVILFQEMDNMSVYRLDGGKRTLLGKAGWLSPAYTLQFDQYPEFGAEHRTGFLLRLLPKQTIRLQVVNLNKTAMVAGPVRPLLFSRTAYGQFLDSRVAKHLHRHRMGLIFTGCLLIMFLYTSMQYVILHDRVLLYYSLYVLLIILRSLISDNYLDTMDGWPLLRSAGFVSRFSLTFLYWSLAVYVLFMREYIQLKTRSVAYDRVFLGIIGTFLLYGVADVFVTVDKYTIPTWEWVHRVADISVLMFGIYTLHTLWRFYDSVTKYLFWGVLFFMSSGLASIVNRILWSDSPIAYDREVAIFILGYILEILTFALGIAQRHELIRQEKLRYQAALIDQLRENERKQARLNGLRDEIARDLHDEMGSQLSSISILSQTTARHLTDERARQRLTTIGQTARQVMDSMRQIVWSLNSSSDSMQHIGLRIQETATALFGDSLIRLHMSLPDQNQLTDLTEKQKREVCLIARESLTNILRHARAKHVGVHLKTANSTLVLIICDDGIGFDTHAKRCGLGLDSIQQRAERLNAHLTIESDCGEGTILTLTCPISNKSSANGLSLAKDYGLTTQNSWQTSHEYIPD